MKQAFLLFFFLLLLAGSKVFAQGNNPPPLCGIYYDYDAAGQRTQRSYDCRAQNNGNPALPPPGDQSTLSIRLFPNPTPGPYTVEFLDPPAQPAHYHWYGPDGQIVGGGLLTEQQSHGNIAAWADGVYLFVAYLPAGPEAIRVIKITQ